MSDEIATASEAPILEVARQALATLLGKMQVQAQVTAAWGEVDEEGMRPLRLDVQGEELNFLIGPKGETLDALQSLLRLMLGKQLNNGLTLVVDIQGHKHHREEQLRRVAQRMAEQAVRLNKVMALEPMPAHERRLVHLALRDHPEVHTESVGEGARRKVTIVPNKP